MDRPPVTTSSCFVASRFIHSFQHRFYYPFGNTSAEDLLEHVPDSSNNPSVLLLGCGDVRSCLYTLWKNFDEVCGHGNFNGVTFYLNDYCAAVLARNILLLYLTLKLAKIPPSDELAVKKMVCSIWNIWFCHDLQPSQIVLLRESILTLLDFCESDETWFKPNNSLQHLIKFFGDFPQQNTREQVYLVFKMWLKMLNFSDKQAKVLRKKRKSFMESMQRVPIMSSFQTFWAYMPYLALNLNFSELLSLMEAECHSYVDTGNAFAEKLFGLDTDSTKNTILNPTFYEKENEYQLQSTALPYECFGHSFFMTRKKMNFPRGTLIVDQTAFDSFPLHANSFQQFSIWLVSVAKCLSRNDSIRFFFNHSDAIATAIQLNDTSKHSFDIIHASNLIDHVSSFAIVTCAIPLLKENGLLLTTTMLYQFLGFSNVRDFVEMAFGMKVENLIPTFGIRCVGREGAYAGDGVLCPTPALKNPKGFLSLEQQNRKNMQHLLLWRKVKATTPLCLPVLQKISVITETLFTCIKSAILGFVKGGTFTKAAVGTCSHTAIRAILCFLAQLSGSESSAKDFIFWENLCERLRSDILLKPFLLHLQCQAVAMNIHMHLIVTESDCPICNSTAIEHYLHKFSLAFSLELAVKHFSNDSVSIFLVCLHPNGFDIGSLQNFDLSLVPSNVFLFDSSSYHIPSRASSIAVEVLVPRGAIDADSYSASLVFRNYSNFTRKHAVSKWRYAVSRSCCLKSAKTSFVAQSVTDCVVDSSCFNLSTSLGKLTLLDYVENHYLLNVTLSEEALQELQNSRLTSKLVSDMKFEILCNRLSFPFEFGIPVDYDSLSIKYSKKRQLVIIEAPCKPFNTYSKNQLALFFCNPENKICLPTINTDNYKNILEASSGSQMTDAEKLFLDKHGRYYPAMLPSINAKEKFTALFQDTQHNFIHLITTNEGDGVVYGLIVVHNRCFDVENQTTAVDLSYYINASGIDRESHPAYRKIALMAFQTGATGDLNIRIHGNELAIVEAAFTQFHERTRVSKNAVNPLSKYGLEDYFRRAVVYCLTSTVSCDELPRDILQPEIGRNRASGKEGVAEPVRKKSTVENRDFQATPVKIAKETYKAEKNVCNFCKSELKKILKCSKCLKALYCGRECQIKDWKVHKASCEAAGGSSSITTEHTSKPNAEQHCTYCQGKSDSLKRCTRCRMAAYCSKKCQTADWSKHKLICN